MINIKSNNPAMAKEVLKECNITAFDLLDELNTRIRWAKSSRDSYESKIADADTDKAKQALREDVIYYEAQVSILASLKQSILDKSIQAIAN